MVGTDSSGERHDLTRTFRSENAGGAVLEAVILLVLFFIYAGDIPPAVNEAHYLVKAKSFWQPEWCQNDLFVASEKAHVVFYAVVGWLTFFCSLETTAWIGRLMGWLVIAIGLSRLCRVLARLSGRRPHWMASLTVAVVWIAGIEKGNLAGEWVIGGTEGKVFAYGFVLLGLAEWVQQKWNRVWVWFGLASAFHVLTGGWAVVAALIARFVLEKRAGVSWVSTFRTVFGSVGWVGLVIGGLVAMAGVIPAIRLTLAVDPETSAESAKIYTYFRISHHLLPSTFPWSWYLRHAVLLSLTILSGLMVCKRDRTQRRLWGFLLGTLAISAMGMVIGWLPPVSPEWAAKLLRYYWFRLADAVVPLMLGLWMVEAIYGGARDESRRDAAPPVTFSVDVWGRRTAMVLVLVCFLWVVQTSLRRIGNEVPPSTHERLIGRVLTTTQERQRQTFEDWKRVCRWAKDSSPTDEVFLTPRHQQTFKWYADRAEVVNWKDVPQDAKNLLEWKRRITEVFPAKWGSVRVSINYETLRGFRNRYDVRYMIVDRLAVGKELPLVRLYPRHSDDNLNYAVYELPH